MSKLTKKFNLDKYTDIVKLGQGAFGIVYKVFDKKKDRTVVIKELDKINKDGRSNEQLILTEVDILHQLKYNCNKGIMCLLSFREDDLKFYIITEYLGGYITLEQYIQKYDLLIADLLTCISNLLEGMEAIHKAGVAHRDIKPENIMINPSTKEIKYIDFGLSCRTSACYTAGSVTGTWYYMAPEVFMMTHREFERAPKSLQSWFKADYWSLGMTMLEIILGYSFIQYYGHMYSEDYKDDLKNLGYIYEKLYVDGIEIDIINQFFKDKIKNGDMISIVSQLVIPLVEINPRDRELRIVTDASNLEQIEYRIYDETIDL